MKKESNQRILIPRISIHPERICCYNEIDYEHHKPSRQRMCMPFEVAMSGNTKFTQSSRTANGLVSTIAKKKINKAIDYLLLMSNTKHVEIPTSGKELSFRIAFVTLTLPAKQIHTDNEIKDVCLNSFLQELTKYHRVKNYIWRAEKQQNGNIHFHLIIDKFILYSDLRKRWNRNCEKLGYVSRYQAAMKLFFKDGFRMSTNKNEKRTEEQQRKAFIEGLKSDFRSPNSTDIHKIRFISNIKAYVTKYMQKQPEISEDLSKEEKQKLLVQGRLWGCNTDLSDIKGFQSRIDSEIGNALEATMKATNCNLFRSTYYTVYYISLKQLKKFSPDILFKYFASYMCEHFKFNSQLELS